MMARDAALLLLVGGGLIYLNSSTSKTPREVPVIIPTVPTSVPINGETSNTIDSNDPKSSNYRGYHADVTPNEDNSTTLSIKGKIPYQDEFNALDQYNIRLLPIAGDTYAMLSDGKGVMRVGDIISGTAKVGKVTIFYLNDSYTKQTGEQSFAQGSFQK